MAKKKTRAAKKTAKSRPKKARVGKPARPAIPKSKGTTRAPAASPPPTPAAQQPEAATKANVLDLEAVDALRALTEELGRLRADQARERDERDKEHAAAQAVWSSTQQAVLDIQRRMARFEESQRQPVEDKTSEGEDDGVWERRRMFAGFCRHEKLLEPTPAILGRALDQEKAYDSRSSKSPYELFDTILINYRRMVGSSTDDCPHLAPDTVKRLSGKTGHKDAANEKHYRQKCDSGRMPLLVNTGLAKMERNVRGTYDRFLTVEGRELFYGWPDWADASGGLSLAEPPPLGTTAPEESVPSPEAPTSPEQAASAGPPIPPPTGDAPTSMPDDNASSPPPT